MEDHKRIPANIDFGPTELHNRFRELFSCHAGYLGLSDSLVRYFKSDKVPRPQTEHQKAQQAILSLAINSFAAIPYLCNYGFGNHAMTLVRKLFEFVISIKFLRIDVELYPFLFNHNPHIYEIVDLHDMEDDNSTKSWARPENYLELLSVAKSEFRKLQTTLPAVKSVSDIRRYVRNWSGVDHYEMCRRIDEAKTIPHTGFVAIYDGHYRGLSQFTHSTGMGRHNCVRLEESGWILDPRPSDRHIPQAFVIGSEYFCRILEDIILSDYTELDVEIAQGLLELYKRNRENARKYNLKYSSLRME